MASIGILEGKPWTTALAMGAGFGIVILGAFWNFKVKPMNETLEKQEKQLVKLQDKIQEGRAAKQNLPRFREDVKHLELELEKLLRILPEARSTDDLLRRIRALAEQGDHELLRFKPKGFIDHDFYSEWPIDINLNGTYHNLAMFFDRVSKFSRIINVDSLKVKASSKAGGVHTISSTFTAKTYIYKEESDGEGK